MEHAAPPPAGAGVDASAPAASSRADPFLPAARESELARLRAERDGIDRTGPLLMMLGGYAGTVLLGGTGVMLLGLGASCDGLGFDERSDCDAAIGVGIGLTVLGVAGAVIGIWGLVKLLDNSARRNALAERIQELTQRPLSLDLRPHRDGLTFGLRLRL